MVNHRSNQDPAREGPRPWRRVWRWLVRSVASLIVVVVSYVALAVAGLFPVNRDYVPSDEGIAVYVGSNGVHTDIYVPATTDVFDWRMILLAEHFRQPTAAYRYVALGWGDRDFYVETPTWEDLSVATTGRALLLPTETIMHAQFGQLYPESDSFRKVTLSTAQYKRLVAALRSSFQADPQGNPLRLEVASYNGLDCFYLGQGTYHALNTCNCWTGRMLRESGVKAGWFTPIPYSVLFHLPRKTDSGSTSP